MSKKPITTHHNTEFIVMDSPRVMLSYVHSVQLTDSWTCYNVDIRVTGVSHIWSAKSTDCIHIETKIRFISDELFVAM